MDTCEFVHGQECRYPHKCKSMGCGYSTGGDAPGGHRYRTLRLPWEPEEKRGILDPDKLDIKKT